MDILKPTTLKDFIENGLSPMIDASGPLTVKIKTTNDKRRILHSMLIFDNEILMIDLKDSDLLDKIISEINIDYKSKNRQMIIMLEE